MNLDFFLDSFMSVFNKGGFVLVFIFVQFLLMWFYATQKYLYFKNEFNQDFENFKADLERLKNENTYFENERVQKYLSILKLKMKSHISLIQLMVMLAPLFGLLGTVTGMISVFDVMAVAGSGNARAMASGISKATIPTMAGMVGALTGLFFVNYIKTQLKVKNAMIADFVTKWSMGIKQ